MPTIPLDDPRNRGKLEEAVRLIHEHGTAHFAFLATGISSATLQHRYNAAKRLGLVEPEEGMEVRAVSVNDRSGERRISYAPPRGPVVADTERVIHGTTHIAADGRLIQAWPKMTRERYNLLLAEAIGAAAKEAVPQPTPPAPRAHSTGRVNVIAYYDAHIGGRSWGRETGENYDLDIAEKTIDAASDGVHAELIPAERALIIWGGDNIHAADDTWQTPANRHILQGDDRIFKVAQVVLRVVKRTILRALETHDLVDVDFHRGNHDEHSARMIGLALAEAFAREPRVNLHVPAGDFSYRRYGSNLIMSSHGDKVKLKDFPLLMAVERPDDWSRTTTRHVYVGHEHRQKLEDVQSVLCMRMPPIAARDGYAAGRGLHSVRGVLARSYDFERGYRGEVFERIDYSAEREAA